MTTGPDPSGSPGEGSDEDALWREIVDNYGDRVELDEPASKPPPPAVVHPETEEELSPFLREEHFIPPTPPPVGWPKGPTAVALIGLLGGPLVVLVMMVLHMVVPTWFGWFVLLGFIGGFGFLVSEVRHRDEWDDGSQV